MRQGGNPFVQLPAGRYPVRITIADVSKELDGSHLREAYASVVLGSAAEASLGVLLPMLEGEQPGDPVRGNPGDASVFVDAGTACFVDDAALLTGMPPEDAWPELFESDAADCWFARMDDPAHIRSGIANILLPQATDGANMILFHSGWGDGSYPLVGGYDANGNLVAVHIDFQVVGEPQV
jgi:hypothetical protein